MTTVSKNRLTDEELGEIADPPALPHHCIRCGKTEPVVAFRSPAAQKCELCDAASEIDRKRYHLLYHRARGRAIRRLIKDHEKQFADLLVAERAKIDQEERQKRATRARKGSSAPSGGAN